ncbi:hypothetical protein P4B35_02675 [Pontiellaceae bacterium B12227]|nr:hypothetical protein [Pontiellaceae bacterium B12227]
MKKISSPFTKLHKTGWIVFGAFFIFLVFPHVFSDAVAVKEKTVNLVFVLSIILFEYWMSFKLNDVFLIKNGIFIKGFFKSEEIMINNIYDVTDLWFVQPRLVVLKFNTRTRFGKWTLLVPKRESFLSGTSPGVDALRRAIGK